MSSVPRSRLRTLNDAQIRAEGTHVLYWMTAFRRLSSNFALQHAVETSRRLGRPLVILEALRVDYPWASDRLHRFVLDGMAEHARALGTGPVVYYPYVERAPGAGRGLLEALAANAALVIGDDYPSFFLPRMTDAAARRLQVRLEVVDSNGLLPIREAGRGFPSAYLFRRYLQSRLPDALGDWPARVDLSDLPRAATPPIAEGVRARWPAATLDELGDPAALAARLPIDHRVACAPIGGGTIAARAALSRFVADRLSRYADDHAHPDLAGTSGLSPWLHFGHLSAHDVFESVMTAERWTRRRIAGPGKGQRSGWWGASAPAEAFLDQLVTWRELGFNLCAARPGDYWRFDSLPDWARDTLDRHAGDRREFVYTLDEFDRALTHDAVWNAAQRQLTRDGWMHNYLRMLWGKKILEWTASPAEALETMIALMDRHAVDGRDPNSYAGYSWILGRFDRPWFPERPIFGTIRYMSSANTVRKLRMKAYLQTYGESGRAF